MLKRIAKKLEHTPRSFENVPLLSELAGYLHQFMDDAKAVVKLFARMAKRWAETARSYEDGDRSTAARQKECVLYGFALLAYSLGPLDDKAAQEVCELVVLFRTYFLCARINAAPTEQMLRVDSNVDEMMTRRISELIAFVERSNANKVLTGLVRLVSPTSPKQLEWTRTSESPYDEEIGSCFESAVARYAINLFTGVVLTDGNAPGGLPMRIQQHERFKSLFGSCNFEVFSVNGVLRTESMYYDRVYDFALQPDEDLLIQELELDSSSTSRGTLQLCSLNWIEMFSELFPSRLRELFSHWYWVEQRCVLFRPIEAKSREVFFVAAFDKNGALQCYRVPFSETECSYELILKQLHTYDRLVQREDVFHSVLSVLTKFEDEKFLHPLKSPEGVVMIELPRFKMGFTLNSSIVFESMEHKGYVLTSDQQLGDFLPRISRYLVLELQDKSDTSRPELRILLPIGAVLDSCMIDIEIPSQADSIIEVACYDLHRRFKVFETETISARLQLAAVCALAGTNVPSKFLQMTGAEAALQILRACRPSGPFSDDEKDILLGICKLSYREPSVKVLAAAWLAQADRLAFLYDQTAAVDRAMTGADEKTEYAHVVTGRVQRNPLRSHFRYGERFISGQTQYASAIIPDAELVSLDPPPVADEYVKHVEAKLGCFVRYTAPTSRIISPLPLVGNTNDAMCKEMLEELQASWNCHKKQPQMELKESPEELVVSLSTLRENVASHLRQAEKYLWGAFEKATSSNRDCLLTLANFLPNLTVSDIVRCSFDQETLYALTQNLTETAREHFKKGVLQYMELCVLEDKLKRLFWKSKCSSELSSSQLVEELSDSRQWSSAEFPYWLAFEVEGRLQIRHEQFVIAQHLINKPGTVCQVNMGRGKTRVILPMLFLYFTRSRFPRVVRAHFLGPLLSEARQFMHRYSSASNAQLGIFEQPFQRQIDLDVRKLEIIRDTIEELKLFGGVQMVSPEHRMSLELKRLELNHDESVAKNLDEILDNNQFVDVLDECDALLHHKSRLVYAVGTPIPLCSGIERWKVAEALLRAIADKSSKSRVVHVLQAPHVACTSPDYSSRLGAFDGTRLNAVVESTERLREQLKKELVLDVIHNAPFELIWLNILWNRFESEAARESLVRAITDPRVSLLEALGDHMQTFAPYIQSLLALRGLVAFGILEHCMEKRYRVDFGLPRSTRQKKIAIPFRAADVPAERSEFSHPDVCIVLTLLGYYHGGLTDDKVRSAFERLLRLDVSEQEHQYGQWFKSVEPGLDGEEQKALCEVSHVSLADARQFETLCRVYKFCMEAINFFLNTCIFPKETQQYSQRLSRTAWNLAAGGKNIGFSGTNDNHRLLPLSVTQCEPEESALLGTNGKMIDSILKETQSYEVIRPCSQTSQIPWKCVLRFALAKGAQALIGTGALLAGVTNDAAADFLLRQPGFSFAGVTYYASRDEHNCWMVAEKARRVKMPLKKAAMIEKETFVIFDQARSRGSDMKLPHTASALLTLGPKLTKDNLMQGAGRMRQLGCNQTLWIASFDEVAQSILQTSGKKVVADLTALDVLNWAMDNTKTEAVRGLLEWAGNGIHFRKTQLKPEDELVDEDFSLETLYQEKLSTDKIARVIEDKARIGLTVSDDALIDQICRRGFVYGLDDEVCVTAHTDECERELQEEEEVQQMHEVEIAQCSPAKEKAWDYKSIFRAESVEGLEGVNLVSLESFVRQWVSPKGLADVAWPNISGTENFVSTITMSENNDHLNVFLRVIDAMVIFDNGQVLLVSECEADRILELMWQCEDSSESKFRFVNFALACESVDRVCEDVRLALGQRIDQELPLLSITACHLFNGETTLVKHQEAVVEPRYRGLLRLLAQRESTLNNFIESRGNGHKWTRSRLHTLCCLMDLEGCN